MQASALRDHFSDVVEAVRMISCASGPVVTEHTRLSDDLGFDSVDLIDLALVLEERYGFEIPYQAVCRFSVVSDLVAYVALR